MKILLAASVAVLALAAMAPVGSNSKPLALLLAGGGYVGTSQQIADSDNFSADARQQTADSDNFSADARQQTADSDNFSVDARQQTADSDNFSVDARQQTADSGDSSYADASA